MRIPPPPIASVEQLALEKQLALLQLIKAVDACSDMGFLREALKQSMTTEALLRATIIQILKH